METRSINTSISSTGNRLEGYAALYNTPSHLLTERGRKFIEIIAPNAFQRTLSTSPDVTARFTHDGENRPPLGRTKSGTLTLTSDQKGLRFSLELPQWASDIKESVQRGDITGMSFGFTNWKDSWMQKDGINTRTLHDFDLDHIALVVTPAYEGTFAQVRSMVEVPDTIPTTRAEKVVELMSRKM